MLIIDDDRLFVATACEAFQKRGLVARGASTADEGLEALAGGRAPKLILLDLILPGLSSRDFLAMVRSEIAWAHTPVVIVTAANPGDVPGDMQCDGLVHKPVDLGELVSLAYRYCRRS
ncbi:MAG TPA: response regulator [Vicinamibacteria bacterium]|nr:response regulator [Vicinamibacteria bacterium]